MEELQLLIPNINTRRCRGWLQMDDQTMRNVVFWPFILFWQTPDMHTLALMKKGREGEM